MDNLPKLLFKSIEDKTIVWLSNRNEYLVLQNEAAAILEQLQQKKPIENIAEQVAIKLDTPIDDTKNFITRLKEDTLTDHKNKEQIEEVSQEVLPKHFQFEKYYKINNLVFKVAFDNELELSYVHPKFAHLVVEKTENINCTFSVFTKGSNIYFYVDQAFIGGWTKEEIHFFQGKFSMELIQKIHGFKKNEWLGIFHASAVSNGKKALLFLGDSGNGKSTSLSLLQAHGFTCLADDFVPVNAKNQNVYSFPAAISIKKTSVPVLLPLYPELETSAEYHFKRLNKVVRYVKPNNSNYSSFLPCKSLIFIKYEKDSEIQVNKISKLTGFEQLVPDSWLSPEINNSRIFLDWFANLECYQITYSNNKKMIDTVTKLFADEL